MAEDNRHIKDYIKTVTDPIFYKAAQEMGTNSMTTPIEPKKLIFRPNNYRRQIKVKPKTDSIAQEIRGAIPSFPMELSIVPRTKLITIKNYMPNITLQYGKDTLTAIYSQPKIGGVKGVYLIERQSYTLIEQRINEIKQQIKHTIDKTLKKFIRAFKIGLPYKQPVWARHEDYIKGEEVINSIPREVIIHDTVFKKVYGKGIEFFGGKGKEPTATLKQYIKNRAVEDIAPEIAESINKLGYRFDFLGTKILNMMNTRIKVDQELAINIKTHNSVFKKLDRLLSQKTLNRWL